VTNKFTAGFPQLWLPVFLWHCGGKKTNTSIYGYRSLLHNGYQVSFQGVKRPGRGV